MNQQEKHDKIETIVTRIKYNLDNAPSEYAKTQVIKKLVEQLSDEAIFMLAFAIEMTPTLEQIAQAKSEQEKFNRK